MSILKDEMHEILVDVDCQMSGRRVLITGAAGFLGSWLCNAFVEMGAWVTAIDDLSTGRIENIKSLMGSEKFEFIEGDVSTMGRIHGTYDLILHFAHIELGDEIQDRPIDLMLAESLGTLNVLRVAEENSCPIVFASTCEVYGEVKVVPTPEICWGELGTMGTFSPRSESKRFGEALCNSFRIQRSLDVRIVRMFDFYGPRQMPNDLYGNTISNFLFQALNEEPITIQGDGGRTSSFCYVTDVVRGIIKIATSGNARFGVFNIGSPHEISIIEVADLVKSITNSGSEIVYVPMLIDEPRRRCPDISKAREILGWRPRINLKIGLERTIRWMRDNCPVKAWEMANI